LSGADSDYITELFAGFGPVTVRRMFSGAGIFADGLMIALVVDGVIFLKADEETVPRFERESLAPFSYKTKDGRRTLMSYWRLPERLYDDPDELADWARQSMAVAQRSGVRTKRPLSKSRSQSRSKSDRTTTSGRPARKRRSRVAR
jgi:DNA transformation protein and related proteins